MAPLPVVEDLYESIGQVVAEVARTCVPSPGLADHRAQIYIAWSHPGRCRNEAAFARLAGVPPIEASSGPNRRHRLNRHGDCQLNRRSLARLVTANSVFLSLLVEVRDNPICTSLLECDPAGPYILAGLHSYSAL